MKLPLTKRLNEKDSLAFVMYSNMAKKEERPNELLSRFTKRVGIDLHDYMTACKSVEFPKILEILKRQKLLVS